MTKPRGPPGPTRRRPLRSPRRTPACARAGQRRDSWYARRRRARRSSCAGELSERPANVSLAEDGTHDFHADEPGRLAGADVTEFELDGFKAHLSPEIDCHGGWPARWRLSPHAPTRSSWSACSPTSSRRWPRPRSAPGGAHRRLGGGVPVGTRGALDVAQGA